MSAVYPFVRAFRALAPRRRGRPPARPAALGRGRAERARRPAARQRRLGPGRRPADRIRLLPLRAPHDLHGDGGAGERHQAGRRDHRVRAAAEPGQGRGMRRAGLPQRPGAERAERRQHPPLRRDRARALGAAKARRGERRDRHLRVQSAGPPGVADPRRGRGQDLPHRRGRLEVAPGLPEHGPARGAADRPGQRAARERRRGSDRRAHRLLRPRPAHLRACRPAT